MYYLLSINYFLGIGGYLILFIIKIDFLEDLVIRLGRR